MAKSPKKPRVRKKPPDPTRLVTGQRRSPKVKYKNKYKAASPYTGLPLVGQKTKYKPEYAEQVVKLGKKGYSPHQMAAEMGCAKSTMSSHWAKDIPEFAAAYDLALTYAQAFWEARLDKMAARADRGHGPRVTAITFVMARRFRRDYHEKFMTTLGNEEGEVFRAQIDYSKLPDEELAKLYSEKVREIAGNRRGRRTPAD